MNEGYIFYCEMLGIPLPFDVLFDDDDEADNDAPLSDVVDLNDADNVDVDAGVKVVVDIKNVDLKTAKTSDRTKLTENPEPKSEEKSSSKKSKLRRFLKALAQRKNKWVNFYSFNLKRPNFSF